MSQDFIDGAQARANNQPLDPRKSHAWQRGWGTMDNQIHMLLHNAKQMLNDLRMIRRPTLLSRTAYANA